MKLNLNDRAKTTITNVYEIYGFEYIYQNGIGNYKLVFVNGLVLVYDNPQARDKDYRKMCKKDLNFTINTDGIIREEDTAPIYNHGDGVYSCITAEGNGGVYVWDSVKQDVVNKKDLSALV